MELEYIKSMFDAIAPRYDFLNRLLSLRQDVSWRRQMIRAIRMPKRGTLLDVACGTGDVIIEALKQKPLSAACGVDFAPEMLMIARNKIAGTEHAAPVWLLVANGLRLPFAAGSIDAVTIAFGIRNIIDRHSALAGFREVLKPGGTLAVLELNTPPPGLLRRLYLLYFEKILPAIGGLFSKNMGAYQYLPASVLNFPPPKAFAKMMQDAGFTDVAWKSLTFGIATVYIGRK